MPKIKQKHYRRAKETFQLIEHSSTDVNIENPCNSRTNSFSLKPYTPGSSIRGFDGDVDGNETSDTNSSFNSDLNTDVIPEQICDIDTPTQNQAVAELTLSESLASWAVHYKIPHIALNNLLHILKPIHGELPLDGRTLLETPRNYNIRPIEPGHYHHFGLENCVKSLISQCYRNNNLDTDCLEILVNIDGLPITKSSSSQFYPILCSLDTNETVVGMVGIYHGYEKPKDPNTFLQEFVTEAIHLIEHGVDFNFKTYSFKIKYFICDVPAKSYILCTKGHSGYYSCTKCDVEGCYINGRVCFPEQKFNLRTDDDFRQKKQPEHHNGITILEQLPNFDIIQSFILDPMHLIYLGIMKKLIILWCTGKPPHKLRASSIESISKHLIYLKNQVPLEFNRKPRSLFEYKRWKATEFRHFVLYLGPVVLKQILNNDMYLNFLSFHIAITILSNGKLNIHFREQADVCLQYFLQTFSILFGKENVSHNFHCLLHLANNSDLNPLDKYSAFHFENYMSSILKMIRKHDRPLAQIIRRKGEIDMFIKKKFPNTKIFQNLSKITIQVTM